MKSLQVALAVLLFAAAARAACPNQDTLSTACSTAHDDTCCNGVFNLAKTQCCQNDLSCSVMTSTQQAFCCLNFDFQSLVTSCVTPGVSCCNIFNQMKDNRCCGDVCKSALSVVATQCATLFNNGGNNGNNGGNNGNKCAAFQFQSIVSTCAQGVTQDCCNAVGSSLNNDCCGDACQAVLKKFTNVCNAVVGLAPSCLARGPEISTMIANVVSKCQGAGTCTAACAEAARAAFRDPCFNKFCGDKCSDAAWSTIIPAACKIQASLGGLANDTVVIRKILQKVINQNTDNIIDLIDQGAKVLIPTAAAKGHDGTQITAAVARIEAIANKIVLNGVAGAQAAAKFATDIISLVPHGTVFNDSVTITFKPKTNFYGNPFVRLCAVRADSVDDSSNSEFFPLPCPLNGLTVNPDGTVQIEVKSFSALGLTAEDKLPGAGSFSSPVLAMVVAAAVAAVAAFMY